MSYTGSSAWFKPGISGGEHVEQSNFLESVALDTARRAKAWLKVEPEADTRRRCPQATELWEKSHREVNRRRLVKINFYPHERITIRAYLEGVKVRPWLSRPAKRLPLPLSEAILVKSRETQHELNILGRLKKKPLKTRFTPYLRNILKDAAHIIETDSEGQGVFITLTTPGGSDAALNAYSIASGAIVNRLNTWLNRQIQKGEYVYVWELNGSGMPHLHYLLRLKPSTNRARFQSRLKREWRSILLDVSGSSGVDLFERKEGGTWRGDARYPRIQVKKIERTYVQYLAKYLSKTKSKGDGQNTWHPGRWGAVSYRLRKEVLARRLSSVVRIDSVTRAVQEIKSLGLALAEKVAGTFLYSGIPKGDIDGISIACRKGQALPLFQAMCGLFGDGDYTGIYQFLDITPGHLSTSTA